MRLVVALICLFLLAAYKQPVKGISVEVTGLRNNNGYVLASLFKEGNGFPDQADKAVRKVKLGISNRTASIVFSDIQPGQYAIAILHDENSDQKMNTNGLGIPKEGYGFSNNVTGAFGPPSFKRASFKYNGDLVSVVIRTRY
ncbi:MAG TPA: DUF2141 domain-containing protein [Chitinophagaceae bacterium]|nr:DUF2141 domain-containing protein [Chitinophagaceae bacterium]